MVKPRPVARNIHPPQPDISSRPFERFYLDIVDFGSADSKGMRYLLTIMDHLTNFFDGVPLPDKSSNTTAQGILELILRHNALHGKAIIDNGSEFRRAVQDVFKLFNVSISHIAPR